HSPSPESPEAKALGHFANGETNGWTTQGLVRNILGEVVEQDGHLQLAAGALSNEHHEGNFAAVRSPTFLLDKDSIVVRARGKQATVRLIIDNFQLIQNPIYGELELHLDNEEYADLLFPVGPWLGHKAYLEVHTGQYDRHHLHITEKSSFALQWAQDFDQERPKLPSVEEATAHPAEALDRWENGKATGGDIVLLNQLLEKQPISHKVREIARESGASGQVVDSLLFQGVVEGDAVFSPIFLRGSHMSLADTAESHRFLSAVGSGDMSIPQVGSGRLAFAEALVHPENPLTARVMVNRIWHHLFGRGLVETVDNFGLQGKAPTHPALLDHLAIRFMESGWSIKDLIRYILLSETFQRSTKASADPNDVDPLNLYLRHYPIRRLEAESIRDGILATSGSLELTMFGPSIPIHLDEFLRGRGRPPASGPLDGKGRRSIYQAIPRNFLPPMMLTFDMPAPFSTFGRRNISNVPAQSLTLMNSPFVLQESERWAAGLLSREASFDDRVSIVYHTAFGREANSAERNEAKQFFSNQADVYGEKGLSAIDDGRIWRDYLHTIFMMKEFIFLI
ncbi:MAG: DUF1553 domain-containing protein, partial [Saprospiraceae bacterium]|nr:DUF1553 domain-containing protein [Saprospiraceae bacterium]